MPLELCLCAFLRCAPCSSAPSFPRQTFLETEAEGAAPGSVLILTTAAPPRNPAFIPRSFWGSSAEARAVPLPVDRRSASCRQSLPPPSELSARGLRVITCLPALPLPTLTFPSRVVPLQRLKLKVVAEEITRTRVCVMRSMQTGSTLTIQFLPSGLHLPRPAEAQPRSSALAAVLPNAESNPFRASRHECASRRFEGTRRSRRIPQRYSEREREKTWSGLGHERLAGYEQRKRLASLVWRWKGCRGRMSSLTGALVFAGEGG